MRIDHLDGPRYDFLNGRYYCVSHNFQDWDVKKTFKKFEKLKAVKKAKRGKRRK